MPPPAREPSAWTALARLGTMGYELVGAIVLLGGLGLLLDWWLGTAPWLVVGGGILGIAVGMYRFIRDARAVNKG